LQVANGLQISYTTEHVPTVEEFMQDSSRIRGIMGPFGCLSGDTEFLTPNGWKRFDEFKQGDFVAEYNSETNQAEFRRPKDYVKLPCSEFYHVKNERGIDQLLSEEHTVLFDTRFAPGKWQTISAKDLVEKHNQLKDGFSGRIPSTFGAPGTQGVDLEDDELRLMVAISADGHFPAKAKARTCDITVRKDRKKYRLRQLLAKCDIDWEERNYTGRPTETHFVFIAPEINKSLAKYFHADGHQLQIVADEFVHWDGCEDDYGGRIFSSTVKEDADFIQYALAATGVRATIAEVEYESKNWSRGYRVYANTGATKLSLRQAPKIEKVPSADGYKYCFETTTGFFIARRNGRIFITGNSGKSSGCLWEIIRRAHQQAPGPDGIRRSRWAIVRNTFPQLNDTTIRTVLDWFPPMVFGNYRSAKHEYDILGFDGIELQLLFRALDKEEHVSNLLSLELTGAWVNEAREVPKAIIDGIDGRLDRYPSNRDGGRTWTGMILDTNPPDDESWWYKLFEVDKPDNTKLFKQPSGLDPKAENICAPGLSPDDYPAERRPGLTDDYYTNMVTGKSQAYIDVYVKGQYGYSKQGKPVYEASYNDDLHIAHDHLEPIPGTDIVVAFDFGLTPSAIILQVTPRGRLHILDELESEGMGIERFTQDVVGPLLLTKYKDNPVIVTGDPAGNERAPTDERTCFDVLRAEGFKVYPAKSNDLAARIGAVEHFLTRLTDGTPTFQLYGEKPAKNRWSHPHDALQYGCMHFVGEIIKARKSSGRKRYKRKNRMVGIGGY
jgi:hypothetical protein